MTTLWGGIATRFDITHTNCAPVVEPATITAVEAGRWFWDFAPVFERNGTVFCKDGYEIWLALTAPKSDDPAERHFSASLAVLKFAANRWTYCGELALRGLHPGDREWAGMAVIESGFLHVFFTSAGDRQASARGYQQRLWTASAPTEVLQGIEAEWSNSQELIRADDGPYLPANEAGGTPGFIRAFRDPFVLHEDGNKYLYFTASSAGARTAYNGAIGLAVMQGQSSWRVVDPVIASDGLTTECERPHIVKRDGLYYLFWSTQSYTFSKGNPGPTGLYGAVSERIDGDFTLLNGDGLVIANPEHQPYQTYSWWITPDLRAQAFVDLPDVPVIVTALACPRMRKSLPVPQRRHSISNFQAPDRLC